MINIKIKRDRKHSDLPLPKYASEGSAGMDLHAAVEYNTTITPGCFKLIPTGLRIQLPRGFEGQIRPRSGLAAKNGITVLNAPGTIDCDYRGEIKVLLINLGKAPFIIERGARIAQLVICRYEKVEFIEVQNLDDSDRGIGGFGHTGI